VTTPASGFSPFSLLHLVCVCACVVGWMMLVSRARTVSGHEEDEARFRRRLGWSSVVFNLAWTLYRFTPSYYDVDASLPLHACDFAWIFGAAAILRRDSGTRLDRAFAYLFGFGLAPLGVITPVLTDGPGDIDFWAFWLRHFFIPACAFVDFFGFRFVPSWRGLLRVTTLTLLALVPITAINISLGVSYFFTGCETPENPTPIDALGEWPLRLLWIGVLGVAWFAALTAIGRRFQGVAEPTINERTTA